MKKGLVVGGKVGKDVLQEFVEQEMGEYAKFRENNSIVYDIII